MNIDDRKPPQGGSGTAPPRGTPDLTPADLDRMTDAELAYLVMYQVACAEALIATVFAQRKGHPPYKAEQFLLGLHPRGMSTSLRKAFEKVRQWAADLPAVVEARAKEQAP